MSNKLAYFCLHTHIFWTRYNCVISHNDGINSHLLVRKSDSMNSPSARLAMLPNICLKLDANCIWCMLNIKAQIYFCGVLQSTDTIALMAIVIILVMKMFLSLPFITINQTTLLTLRAGFSIVCCIYIVMSTFTHVKIFMTSVHIYV